MRLGDQNPSSDQGCVGRQTTHLNGIDSITRFGEGVYETMPVTGGAALRGSALVLEDLAQILEDWAQIPEDGLQILEDWAQILEDRMVQTNCLDHPARPLQAVPCCGE